MSTGGEQRPEAGEGCVLSIVIRKLFDPDDVFSNILEPRKSSKYSQPSIDIRTSKKCLDSFNCHFTLSVCLSVSLSSLVAKVSYNTNSVRLLLKIAFYYILTTIIQILGQLTAQFPKQLRYHPQALRKDRLR